ncbi:MAG: MBL fold metallo-hydrolase [Acidobacteria bacterium]|nr:MBL fold metallo-hydrolase [Acidobacteriota bacterium]
MANPKQRLPGNAPGEFYVDATCIDCDQCRQIAPAVFHAEGDFSVVHRQPTTPEDALRAEMALLTCPTASIGTEGKRDLARALSAYPEVVSEGVHFCGFASKDSFGASSYLIVRPEGNVLVDSPRFAEPLVRRIEALGGVRWMFLTHRDDVADHAQFRRRFGCERILHEADADFPVERPIRGGEPARIGADLLVIPTPGHTEGHHVLLYRDTYLFTGDHLWWSPERRALHASRSVCWYSWPEQRRSVERLLDHRFGWVLPGHGARHRAPPEEMHRLLRRLVAAME